MDGTQQPARAWSHQHFYPIWQCPSGTCNAAASQPEHEATSRRRSSVLGTGPPAGSRARLRAPVRPGSSASGPRTRRRWLAPTMLIHLTAARMARERRRPLPEGRKRGGGRACTGTAASDSIPCAGETTAPISGNQSCVGALFPVPVPLAPPLVPSHPCLPLSELMQPITPTTKL
jgi:hypothetical protein